MSRHPCAMERARGRSRSSSSRRWLRVPVAPLFEQIDLHGKLTHLALQLRDFALVLGALHRLGQFVAELAGFVLTPRSRQMSAILVPLSACSKAQDLLFR